MYEHSHQLTIINRHQNKAVVELSAFVIYYVQQHMCKIHCTYNFHYTKYHGIAI